MKRWIQSGKGIRNFAQCDIRHFYDHAKYKFIRPKLLKRIKDALFMYLIDVCLTWFPDKLPLGFYLSQWLANFLLQELDFLIKCKLKIAHFIRYMGWITHSDTYEWYLMYIKPLISVRAVKRIISKMDKEANKNARMENRELLLTA